MIIMGLLEKHKVKVTLPPPHHRHPVPPPPPPHSHLGWRQWDACATNHLYTLISASGPRCCLLLSEQMTFRKKSELGGKDEDMGRWGKRSGGGEGWGNLPACEDVCGSWNWEGNCVRHMSSSAKEVFIVHLDCVCVCVCVFFVVKWSIWAVYWITFAIVCIPCYYHQKCCTPLNNKEMGNMVHILSVASVWSSLSVSHVTTHAHTLPPPLPSVRHRDSSGTLNTFSMQPEHWGPYRQNMWHYQEKCIISPPAQTHTYI